MHNYSDNNELQLVFDFVEQTGTNIFLTGRAGTGKTTFLRDLQKYSPKRMIVVAPTGVAAINAGGVTIHSFFQLSFAPFIPEIKQKEQQQHKINREKIAVIKSIDLLVIDEISMVRADLLDAVDDVLRKYRDRHKPFGGVQLLLIGDMLQLAPVVKGDEWEMLRDYYENPFFFSSKALQKTSYISIELQKVYRQSDTKFIDILNKVRGGDIDKDTITELNKLYIPDFLKKERKGYVILTTHVNRAQQTNQQRLDMLSGESFSFRAKVKGVFPEYSYPTDDTLILKEGAQVMFIKNDLSPEKRYFNGKIGAVSAIDDENIEVTCEDDTEPILVDKELWENKKYSINNLTKEIEESISGTFIQYPLRTAWAITIHKSQGLTFDKAVIDVSGAFAHGQTYVALSRCKTLEGLVLSTPFPESAVRSNSLINKYMSEIQERQPNNDILEQRKTVFYFDTLSELFGYKEIEEVLEKTRKLYSDEFSKLYPEIVSKTDEYSERFKKEIESISIQFIKQLNKYIFDSNPETEDRIKKGAEYFRKFSEEIIVPVAVGINVEIDSVETQKNVKKLTSQLSELIYIKIECLDYVLNSGFNVTEYLKIKSKARLEKPRFKSIKVEIAETTDIKHPMLMSRLRSWRKNKANDMGVPAYVVMHQKSLISIVNELPSTEKEFLKIHGIGKKFIEKYGSEVHPIVLNYRKEIGLSDNDIFEIEVRKKNVKLKDDKDKPAKIDTKKVTLHLINEGRSMEETAVIRELTVGTIAKHIAHFIKNGNLEIFQFMPKEKVEEIEDIVETPDISIKDIMETGDGKFSYNDIMLVLAHMESER